MDKRIGEFATEAAKYSAICALPTGIGGNELFLEKFTELIVRECINWIDGSPATKEGTLILSKSFIIANLKEHFGGEK